MKNKLALASSGQLGKLKKIIHDDYLICPALYISIFSAAIAVLSLFYALL